MRSLLPRVAVAVVVGLVALACAAPVSPTPITTPSAPSGSPAQASAPAAPVELTPRPAPSRAETAWPLNVYQESTFEPSFGPDGTLYLLTGRRDVQDTYRQSVVALDTGGHVKPGWPIEEPPDSNFGSPVVGPDGSIYVEQCGSRGGCVLHRLDAQGLERPGWPFPVPADFGCLSGSACFDSVAFGPNGTAYLSHWRQVGGLQVIAIDASARKVPGWPIAPEGRGVWWSNAQVGSDGTLFMLRKPDGSEKPGIVAAFGPDGRPRPGWPVSVPDIVGYRLGPQGTVVAWSWVDDVGELCSNPRRTVFTVLGPDGRASAGWPLGSKGFASNPVADADGTVYYVSALGNVYAHDRAGAIKAGWPVAVAGSANGCGPKSPHLAPDGTIYVLGDAVTARSSDGRSRPGWPYRPTGRLIVPCLDIDCVPYAVDPAFGPDGTVYLVVYQEDLARPVLEVVALDREGRLKPGWPYRIPIDPKAIQVGPLTVSPDGRLLVRAGSPRHVLLALDAEGRLAQ
jgi:hypothetical protein